METREKLEGVIPSKNQIGFLEIQSLTQLIPIVLFCFLAAFVIDTYEWQTPVATNNYQTEFRQEPTPLLQPKQKLGKVIEKTKVNQPKPKPSPEVKVRIRKKKVNVAPSLKTKRISPAKKTGQKSTAPVFEEKYTHTNPSQTQVLPKSTEHILETTQVLPVNPKVNPVAVLSTRKIPSLVKKEIINFEKFTLKKNKFPREVKEGVEAISSNLSGKTPEKEQASTSSTLPKKNYKSSDFAWSLNNYNSGLKKSVTFTDTPDGKAAYCKTNAGILLKIKNLSDFNLDYGVFVEKSEDGKEFNSIGIINAENKQSLYYFDTENSFNGQHNYRFRSTNQQGETISFGQVSVAQPSTLNPVEFDVDTKGTFSLNLSSNKAQTIKYELKEAWGSLNAMSGTKQMVAGENELVFNLSGEPGLYFLKLKTGQETLELLLEKPGLASDLSFYDFKVSGKQTVAKQVKFADLIKNETVLNFDFYLKNGNTLIFNQGVYKSETVKIKNAKIENLPTTLSGRHSESSLWFTAASNISYLHQKVPVILEHNAEEIPAQINIYAAKNAVRPISHFSPNGDGIQDNWRIPGIESCPETQLLVFNDWGNLIYQTKHVTNKNIWRGQKDGEDLPAGIYYYILGNYGGWVQLER